MFIIHNSTLNIPELHMPHGVVFMGHSNRVVHLPLPVFHSYASQSRAHTVTTSSQLPCNGLSERLSGFRRGPACFSRSSLPFRDSKRVPLRLQLEPCVGSSLTKRILFHHLNIFPSFASQFPFYILLPRQRNLLKVFPVETHLMCCRSVPAF